MTQTFKYGLRGFVFVAVLGAFGIFLAVSALLFSDSFVRIALMGLSVIPLIAAIVLGLNARVACAGVFPDRVEFRTLFKSVVIPNDDMTGLIKDGKGQEFGYTYVLATRNHGQIRVDKLYADVDRLCAELERRVSV